MGRRAGWLDRGAAVLTTDPTADLKAVVVEIADTERRLDGLRARRNWLLVTLAADGLLHTDLALLGQVSDSYVSRLCSAAGLQPRLRRPRKAAT